MIRYFQSKEWNASITAVIPANRGRWVDRPGFWATIIFCLFFIGLCLIGNWFTSGWKAGFLGLAGWKTILLGAWLVRLLKPKPELPDPRRWVNTPLTLHLFCGAARQQCLGRLLWHVGFVIAFLAVTVSWCSMHTPQGTFQSLVPAGVLLLLSCTAGGGIYWVIKPAWQFHKFGKWGKILPTSGGFILLLILCWDLANRDPNSTSSAYFVLAPYLPWLPQLDVLQWCRDGGSFPVSALCWCLACSVPAVWAVYRWWQPQALPENEGAFEKASLPSEHLTTAVLTAWLKTNEPAALTALMRTRTPKQQDEQEDEYEADEYYDEEVAEDVYEHGEEYPEAPMSPAEIAAALVADRSASLEESAWGRHIQEKREVPRPSWAEFFGGMRFTLAWAVLLVSLAGASIWVAKALQLPQGWAVVVGVSIFLVLFKVCHRWGKLHVARYFMAPTPVNGHLLAWPVLGYRYWHRLPLDVSLYLPLWIDLGRRCRILWFTRWLGKAAGVIFFLTIIFDPFDSADSISFFCIFAVVTSMNWLWRFFRSSEFAGLLKGSWKPLDRGSLLQLNFIQSIGILFYGLCGVVLFKGISASRGSLLGYVLCWVLAILTAILIELWCRKQTLRLATELRGDLR